jgi:hypothetical protein
MRRILLVVSVAALMAAMVVASASAAEAKNTLQFPLTLEGPPLEEPFFVPQDTPPGPPTVSGGPTINSSLVFHCPGGGAEVIKFTKEGDFAGTKGGGDCSPV